MSWAYVNGGDDLDDALDYGQSDLADDIDDTGVWVTQDHQILAWDEVSDSHLRNIIRGIKAGRTFFGQSHKLKAAEAEWSRRQHHASKKEVQA